MVERKNTLRQHQDAGWADAAIVGAGIAGMAAALLLADMGRRVALIERAPWIGGSMHLLDRTFPTDSCGLCFMEEGPSPTYCPTFECGRHPHILLLPSAELTNLAGQAGDFHLSLRQSPRCVDAARCTGCGLCEEACPIEGPSLYEGWLSPRKAIYRPPARALPRAHVIDAARCTRCGRCVPACPEGAIDLEKSEEERTLRAGAVILSPGFEPFDAAQKGEYGFGVLANVLTSLQFERLISFSGSTHGRVLRPSDGKPAERIAFISCVGSRDARAGREYCSSVCCMINAKQATLARELSPGIESTIFYIDLRAQGREDEAYLAGRIQAPGLRYVRSQVSTLKESQRTKDVLIEYWDEAGQRREERFDMAVLAVGLGAPAPSSTLAAGTGIALDAYGFAQTGALEPLCTAREGVFAAGAFQEPKDIPHSMAQAGAAAALAAIATASAPAPDEEVRPTRPELADEEPRLGVFIATLDQPAHEVDGTDIAARAAQLPAVALVRRVPSLRTPAGRDALRRAADEAKLNRLVLVDISPRLDVRIERNLEDVLGALGLPDAALELVELDSPLPVGCEIVEGAPAQLWERVRIAVASLMRRPLLSAEILPALPPLPGEEGFDIAVVGAGPAGMAAALAAAELGQRVALIERTPSLGGQWKDVLRPWEPESAGEWLAAHIPQVNGHPFIRLFTETDIRRAEKDAQGYYHLHGEGPAGELTLAAGALILATGASPVETRSYGYGDFPDVITQLELERLLVTESPHLHEANTVVMIQCVDARAEGRPYCSRTCCAQAVRNALALKEQAPHANVVVLYRDMRTFGKLELEYLEARRQGVRFVRYEPESPPVVRAGAGGGLEVIVEDALLGREVHIPAGLVVLSLGADPGPPAPWFEDIGIALAPDGFLAPEHLKMRPMHLSAPGAFGAGAALDPCFFHEAVSQGRAAAAHAVAYLRRQRSQRAASRTLAYVIERLCSGCELCVAACPYGARLVEPETRIARVLPSLCAGCGTCVMVCPNGASGQHLFEPASLLARIDAALDDAPAASPIHEGEPC